MKKIFKGFEFIGVCLAAALLISCENDAAEEKKFTDFDMGVKNVEIPEWSKNPSGAQDLSDLVLNASASNINETIKAEVKKTPVKTDVSNIIFMFFEGLTDDLIEATEAKYSSFSNGELLLNELPVKLTFTVDKIDDNADESKVVGLYLADKLLKTGSYITTGSVVNNVFRQFKNTMLSTDLELYRVHDMVMAAPRAKFIIAKDNEANDCKTFSTELNEFYKAQFKLVENFKDGLNCFHNEEVEFTHSGHPTELAEPQGLYIVYPASTQEYPSPIQSMTYALTYTEDKANRFGFFVVFYDDAAGEDKNAELKNFDEAVIAASKYVLENPDTILVVTSAALDGSKVPAYVLGNIPDAAKSAATLLDFVKAALPE